MTKTMIETLEAAFEPAVKAKGKDVTLAEAISAELMKTLPRIAPELFTRMQTVDVSLSDKQRKALDRLYKDVRGESEWDKRFMNPVVRCTATIPVFAYCPVPDVKEYVQEGAARVTYEESFKFSTSDASVHLGKGGGGAYDCSQRWIWQRGTDVGLSNLEIKAVWEAPVTLSVCAAVPEVPPALASLGDDALLAYFTQAKALRKSQRKDAPVEKPSLRVLWAPTPESLYCKGEIPQPAPRDPALVLDIPDGGKHYRHVIATWNIGEEKPFRHWLAEYAE
jgi:hypothetical protein